MGLQADRDYLLIGTASLYLPNRSIASGPLLVTPQGLAYASYHETNPFEGNHQRTGSIKEAVDAVKDSVAAGKSEFTNQINLLAARKYMKQVLEREETINDVHRTMAEWAAADSRLIRIAKEDIASLKTGFFTGLKVTMKDGTVHKFRSNKLKAIRAMLGFA